MEYVVLYIGVSTNDGYFFSRESAETIVSDFQNKKKRGSVLGSIGSNDNLELPLRDTSHQIQDMYIVGDRLMADIDILNTKKGDDLNDILKADKKTITFRVSTKGTVDPETKELSIYAVGSVCAILSDNDPFKDCVK